MNFKKLEKNIISIIYEQQLKLGYLYAPVRLYYPLNSINNLLEIDTSKEATLNILNDFAKEYSKKLGELSISLKDERFCIIIPAQGSEYIHNLPHKNDFLKDFITAISSKNEINDIEKIFFKYSSDVSVQYLENGEFDCLIYFTKSEPDDFYYCVKKEHSHLTYHRFTKDDYYEMFGENI